MANLSLGGGDETQPNRLGGTFGAVAIGGGAFAVLTSGGFIRLSPRERGMALRTGSTAAQQTGFGPVGDTSLDTLPIPGRPESEPRG